MTGLLHKTWRLFLILLVALAFFLGAYFYFYPGGYDPPASPDLALEQIALPTSSISTFTEVPSIQRGMLLFDGAHLNGFGKAEISTLLSRVADRGYDIEFIEETRPSLLDAKLRQADSFAILNPSRPFAGEEIDIIERFVGKGGKLLLIAEPTLDHEINSLAERFGVAFQPDYLWNLVEYELNFRNIFIRDFRADELTRGLGQIVLYTPGSIRSSGTGLAITDANTRSSTVDRLEPFYPMVKAGDGHVLAISDLTFMVSPQNSVLDNDRLISNIADYLTDSRRKFELGDFPHFFKGDVDILLGQASVVDVATEIKVMLSGFRIASEIRGVEDLSTDTVFVGLFEDISAVSQYLDLAGVQLDDALRTPFTHDIPTSGTSIVVLHRTQERYVLLILADSPRSLEGTVRLLRSGQFTTGLVSELLGIYGGP